MPLSEEEQRQLDAIAARLYAEDPRLAGTLAGRYDLGAYRARLGLGVLTLLAGLVGLIAGVALPSAALGVLGWVGMLVGVTLAHGAVTAGANAPDEVDLG